MLFFRLRLFIIPLLVVFRVGISITQVVNSSPKDLIKNPAYSEAEITNA